jgi:hypothetical protein
LIFTVIEEKLANFFAAEKARGRIAADADATTLARYCIATIQGAMLLGKVSRDSAAVEAVVSEALVHLKRQIVAN